MTSRDASQLADDTLEMFRRDITLEPIKFGHYVMMSSRILVEDPDAVGALNLATRLSNMFRVGLSAWMLTRTLEDRECVLEIKVPATVFDHVKLWLGRGNVRWRSVRQRVRFVVRAMYPEANVAPRRLGKPVVVSELSCPATLYAYGHEEKHL